MNDAWAKFNKYFWENVVNKYMKGVCVIYMGQQAWKSEQYLAPMLHYSWKVSHPASDAYKGDKWDSENVFQKVDQVLMANNGDTINWIYRVPF